MTFTRGVREAAIGLPRGRCDRWDPTSPCELGTPVAQRGCMCVCGVGGVVNDRREPLGQELS